MRSRSHTILALALIGAVAAAPHHEAQAGKLFDRFKRSPAAVGAAAAAGTVAALHPVATAGALVGAGAVVGKGALVAGGVVVGGAKVMGTALLAATAVSPLAGVVLAGATVYAGAKGVKFIARKIRERRAMRNAGIGAGGLGAAGMEQEISPSEYEALMAQQGMGGGQPTMGASRGRGPSQFDPADFPEEDFGGDDMDLRREFGDSPSMQAREMEGPSRMAPELSPSMGRSPSAGAPVVASRAPSASRSPSLTGAESPSLQQMVHAAAPPSAAVAPPAAPSRGVVYRSASAAAPVAGAAAAGAAIGSAKVPAVARAPRLVSTGKSKSGNAQEVYELANGNKVTRTVWGTKNGTQMAHETERSPSGSMVGQRRGKADTIGAGLPGAKVVSSSKTKAGNTKEILELDDGSRVRVTRWTQGSTPMISVASVDKAGKTIPGTSFQGSEAKYNEQLANQ